MYSIAVELVIANNKMQSTYAYDFYYYMNNYLFIYLSTLLLFTSQSGLSDGDWHEHGEKMDSAWK